MGPALPCCGKPRLNAALVPSFERTRTGRMRLEPPLGQQPPGDASAASQLRPLGVLRRTDLTPVECTFADCPVYRRQPCARLPAPWRRARPASSRALLASSDLGGTSFTPRRRRQSRLSRRPLLQRSASSSHLSCPCRSAGSSHVRQAAAKPCLVERAQRRFFPRSACG